MPTADEHVTKVVIESFHPLRITWPDGPLVGKVQLVLPPIHVQVYDLSMGIDLLKGTHLGSDVPLLCWSMEFREPMDKGDFMKFIEDSKVELEKSWELGQKQFDEIGALRG